MNVGGWWEFRQKFCKGGGVEEEGHGWWGGK
jgi:hypothetical protein